MSQDIIKPDSINIVVYDINFINVRYSVVNGFFLQLTALVVHNFSLTVKSLKVASQ